MAKKQKTRDTPTDVEMEEAFQPPTSDKAELKDGDGGCRISFGQFDVMVCKKYGSYFSLLRPLTVTDDLWIVDIGDGFGISPDKDWFETPHIGLSS